MNKADKELHIARQRLNDHGKVRIRFQTNWTDPLNVNSGHRGEEREVTQSEAQRLYDHGCIVVYGGDAILAEVAQ